MPTTNYNLPTLTDNMTADVVRDHNALATAVDTAIKGVASTVPTANDVEIIDQRITGVESGLTTHKDENASITTKGHVQLSNSVTSTSETLAATSKAVKTAMDRANEAFQSVVDGKNSLEIAIEAKGGTVSDVNNPPTFADLVNGIGTLSVGAKPGTLSVANSSADKTHTGNTNYTRAKEMRLTMGGSYRISFGLFTSHTGTAFGRIYRNGVPVGIERSTTSGNPVSFSEDIAGWSEGDLIQLWIRNSNGSYIVYCSDFTLSIAPPTITLN